MQDLPSTPPTPLWKNRMVMAALIIGGAVAVVCAALYFLSADDEPPIRVRNGSMVVEINRPNKWMANGTDWAMNKGKHRGRWDVKVVSAAGTCNQQRGSGKNITISYSDGNTVKMKLGTSKSLVGDNPNLKKVSDQMLELGKSGDDYFVNEIKVTGGGTGNLTCTFRSRADLTGAAICPPGHVDCQ